MERSDSLKPALILEATESAALRIGVSLGVLLFQAAVSRASAQDAYGGITGPNYPNPYTSDESVLGNAVSARQFGHQQIYLRKSGRLMSRVRR
jgi:hypothetical protein